MIDLIYIKLNINMHNHDFSLGLCSAWNLLSYQDPSYFAVFLYFTTIT